MFCVLRSLATGANFWVANLKSFVHVLVQAIVYCAQPELLWFAGYGSFHGWGHLDRCRGGLSSIFEPWLLWQEFWTAYELPPSSCSSCDPSLASWSALVFPHMLQCPGSHWRTICCAERPSCSREAFRLLCSLFLGLYRAWRTDLASERRTFFLL